MKLRILSFLTAFVLSGILFSGCGQADLRPKPYKKAGFSTTDEAKGRELMALAWKAQGFDNLSDHKVYEVVGKDHWKGLMGGMSNPWPVNQDKLNLKFAIGTFDSRVEVLEGKKKGYLAGLQAWNYYEKDSKTGQIEFQKTDKSMEFVLAAYQYFFEFADRMQRVPLVTFAGKETWNGIAYDRVLCTWHQYKPHKPNDHYLIFLHPETHRIEGIEYTIRENYLPAPGKMYGSIKYQDFREIDGIWIPFKQSVGIFGLSEKDNYLHQLTVESFEFDGFDRNELYPNPDLPLVGDTKD